MRIPTLSDLIDLFLPMTCTGCSEIIAGDEILCQVCWEEAEQHRFSPGIELLNTVPVVAPFEYAFPLSTLIMTAKNRDLPRLLSPLANEMKRTLIETGLGKYPQMIIPIPLHHARRRERGFDQARFLAGEIARLLDLPYLPDALKRIRATPPQKRADRKQRLLALQGAFKPGRDVDGITGKRIVLVDDVVTTGATIRAACEALHTAAPSGMLAIVAARTLPHES